MKLSIRPAIRRFLSDFFDRFFAGSLKIQLRIKAQQEAADYIYKYLSDKPYIESSSHNCEILSIGLNAVTIEGLYMELGVWKGGTINHIAKTATIVYGFDSFEGLPGYWTPQYKDGFFKLKQIPKVRDNVILTKGWFKDTLPGFVRTHKANIAFVHLDADMYLSTKTFFDVCGHMITNGTVIVFNEYFGFPFWQENEHKAFQEWLTESGMKYEYLCYGDSMVAVKIK